MNPGTRVRMNAACKKALIKSKSIAHLQEFSRCIGEVIGSVDYGNGAIGPELDVRWMPSRLKYAYLPEHLVAVPLRAFIVSSRFDGVDIGLGNTLVYAYTAAHARSLGYVDIDGLEYADAAARRSHANDARAATRSEPGIETSQKYLRSQGWHHEGEYTCAACGLYPFGMNEFAVCRDEEMCRDCGCPKDCKHEDGFSCE